MRPAEVDKEAIIEAGQALQAAGRNITGFALRQKVGGGNPSRLVQIWKEHISNQTEAQAVPVAELPIEVAEVVAGVSKELTDRLAALAVELNDKAVKAAERRVAEVVRAAGEQREQAERELADAAATVEDLETKLDAAEEHGREQDAKLAQVQGEHHAQAVELAQVRERLAQIEQASRQAAEQHAAEVKRLNDGIEAERQRHHVALADLTETRNELANVKARADAADQSHQEQRKQAAAEAHRQVERLTKAQAERDTARQEAGQAREDAAKLRGQVEALQTQAGELTRALATVRAAESASAEGATSPDASTPRGGRSKRGG